MTVPADAPSAERVQEFAESIGVRMDPWQVECVRTLLQGGQVVSSRGFGTRTVLHVAEEFRRAAATDQSRRDIAEAFDVDPAAVGLVEPTAPGNRESDVLAAIDQLERDEIDDLVDMQMRQERTGYDYSVNQPKCIHCRGEAHSVPITQRMREMRSLFQSTVEYYEDGPRVSDEVVAQLDAYRYNEDTSEIVCPGSEFIGPPKPPARMPGWALPLSPLDPSAWLPGVGTCNCGWCRASRPVWDVPDVARPATQISDWFSSLSTLSSELSLHLYRSPAVVLLPDRLPRLEMVLGMEVRQVPGLRRGYIACEYEATQDGLASAMCDYSTLDRAGTRPVVVASADVVQAALRITGIFWDPASMGSFDLRGSTELRGSTRRFAELGNMRVDPLPVSAVYVGFRTDAPSAAEVSRLIQAQQPPSTPWTVERITQLLSWPNPLLPGVVNEFTFTGSSDGSGVSMSWAPAPAEPDPVPSEEPQEQQSRRERRSRQARAVPMWVPPLDGRNRRGRRT